MYPPLTVCYRAIPKQDLDKVMVKFNRDAIRALQKRLKPRNSASAHPEGMRNTLHPRAEYSTSP